jgi:hypothetical protein
MAIPTVITLTERACIPIAYMVYYRACHHAVASWYSQLGTGASSPKSHQKLLDEHDSYDTHASDIDTYQSSRDIRPARTLVHGMALLAMALKAQA